MYATYKKFSTYRTSESKLFVSLHFQKQNVNFVRRSDPFQVCETHHVAMYHVQSCRDSKSSLLRASVITYTVDTMPFCSEHW